MSPFDVAKTVIAGQSDWSFHHTEPTRMSTPYIGFGNDTLNKMPKVADGEPIMCPQCQGVHRLECATKDGEKTDLLMFYKCGESCYLGAVAGRLVAGIKSDVSGSI